LNGAFIVKRASSFSAFVSFTCLSTGFVSCQRDDGFISPSDSRNLRPLGLYVGKAEVGDSASKDRLINLVHPKVAVLWRAIGTTDRVSPTSQKSIESFAPFPFSMDLLQPPPPEVVNSPELTFGFFSLFSDVNQNGVFDRPIHPELVKLYAKVDSLRARADAAKAALMEVAEMRAKTPVSETYYLDYPGILLEAHGSGYDTLWRPEAQGDSAIYYLKFHSRLMGAKTRWENFFSNRQRENEIYLQRYPVPGHGLKIDLRYDRRLFPKPGREAEFQARERRCAKAISDMYHTADFINYQALVMGMLNYSFDGYNVPGADWIAGRSIRDLLIYIPSEATLDSLFDAYPTGTFRIGHIERFGRGYNLVHCDDQYVCDVRNSEDSITIQLGTTEIYFNPPGADSRAPALASSHPAAAALAPLAGRYAINGSDTVDIALVDGEIWCSSPEAGLLRVLPDDSLGFYSPLVAFQGLVDPPVNGKGPERLVVYSGIIRNLYHALGQPPDGSILARIRSAREFKRADISDSAAARCAGSYDFDHAALEVSWKGGDSLTVVIPGYRPATYYAVNDSLFRCPWADLSLEFQGGTAPRRVILANGALKTVVPALASSPSNAVRTMSTEAEGVTWVSENQGTGRDTYVDLKGKHRYACSVDGAFLQAGDGYLTELRQASPSDSISLGQGGDEAAFKIPGMKGRQVLLQLRQCAERTSKIKRERVSLWGGPDPDSLRLLYGDDQWMGADAAGTYWQFDSLSIDADPYYLLLKRENTADRAFFGAFDGYRLGTRP
jgi:hypothetical protein